MFLHLIWPGHPPFIRASRLHDLRCYLMKKKGNKKMPTQRKKVIQPHPYIFVLAYSRLHILVQMLSRYKEKQRCRDGVPSLGGHLLVPFLFHEVTSLHPLSFQRNDFSTCYYNRHHLYSHRWWQSLVVSTASFSLSLYLILLYHSVGESFTLTPLPSGVAPKKWSGSHQRRKG